MPLAIPRPATLVSIFLSFLAIILVIVFAPVQVGGAVTYAIVDGNSMEPGFYLGDLVLVRTKPVYGVGDAVMYRNAEMGSFVFHRIVDIELGRYILKGDNNAWLDSYLPAPEEIVGKLWFHIPKMGKVIEWARVPLNMALLVGFLGGVLMFDLLKKTPLQKNEKNAPPIRFGGTPEVALFISGIIALLFLAAGIYAFTRPLYQPVENIPYQQEGYFYYSATGTPGVYDMDMVRSGEPVFPKLTCFLNIGYTYTITGDHLQAINGTHKMSARIMDEQSGWVRTIPLNAETSFNGNSYFTLAALDLCQVESIVNLVEQEAGLNQITYTMEIVADSAFTADVNGAQITDAFSPSLVFRYDKIHFYLAANKSQGDPLRSSQPGLAGGTESKLNTLSLLGFALPIWIVRFVALLGFVFSTLGFAYFGLKIYQTATQSQDALIRLRYGSMLMEVYEQNFAPSATTIDVAAMDDLARLAERHGTMILHMQRAFLHYYLVQSSGTTYRYVISTGSKGAPQTEPPAQLPITPAPLAPVNPPVFAPELPAPVQPEFSPIPIPLPPQWEALLQEPVRQEIEVTQPSPMDKPRRVPVEVPRPPSEKVEYVIRTGAIEFATEPDDTTVLRKIKL